MNPPPFERLRPLRETPEIRARQRDVFLTPDQFIQPFFVVEGQGINHPLTSLHGVSHLSIDELVKAQKPLIRTGVNKVLLFGVIDSHFKTPSAQEAVKSQALVSRAVRELKDNYPDLTVMTDVCLCAYTDHGHCGVINGQSIDNDRTLELLGEMALSHAQAGADVVAPSAMMDGQVWAIRRRLDEAGFSSTQVMGYSAKYASGMYGPFRDAAASAPSFGDRRSYQMDFRTSSQGLMEALADHREGASILMVKPATFYLDIIKEIKARLPSTPLAAYHTSGDYMMLRHGAAAGIFSFEQAYMENLYAIRRAGADLIITYGAQEAVEFIKKETP